MEEIDLEPVRRYLLALQDRICEALEREDASARFEGPDDPSTTRPRVLSDGPVIEKAAVNFTHTRGAQVPATGSNRRPELAARKFDAVSLSWIVHPRSPYAPITHGNLRAFVTADDEPLWWFGGGIDLTPTYGFEDDARHWHETAREACRGFGADLYPRFKEACDRYFHLPHRQEARGIGGLFFDDFSEGGWENAFAFLRSVGDHFLPAYLPILEQRKSMAYGEREREFQLYRRGRYVEFNLLYDRGTRFGLESGKNVESVLASLPPRVSWRYDWQPEPGSPEAELTEKFLTPRNWLGDESS